MMIAERVRTDLHASRIPVGEGHLCRWAQAMTDYGAAARRVRCCRAWISA